MTYLSRRSAILVFLAFALAYFLSALVRAITATLSPTLIQEFSLQARDLGLLAGGYFLGFALMQLPLGRWLDRHGPKRVILCLLSVAVVGCVAFALASSFAWLLAARVMCGVGVCACLMAPLTGFRRWLDPTALLRSNSWMLMTGSMGMVASTLPVQWLMPVLGWRPLFWGLAGLIVLSMVVIAWQVPTWRVESVTQASGGKAADEGYSQVWRHAYFRSLMPMGFFCYGGLLAVQTLWAAPWMSRVAGFSPLQAAAGLFWINMTMLATFWTWGMVNPALARRGWHTDRLISWGLPLSYLVLLALILLGPSAGVAAAPLLALYCMCCSFVSLAQPAVGLAFPSELAGRALSAFNLVIFSGVFVVQWGIGLLVDALGALGWAPVSSFQGAFAIYLGCCVAAHVWFVVTKPHNHPS